MSTVPVPVPVPVLEAVATVVALAVFLRSLPLVAEIFRDASPAATPKRRVPWTGGAACVVFLCGTVLFPILASRVVASLPPSWFPDFSAVEPQAEPLVSPPDSSAEPPEPQTASVAADSLDARLKTQHPMARLLVRAQETPAGPLVAIVFLLVVLVAAPVAEEFLFRTLLQGTLENLALDAVLPPVGVSRRVSTDSASGEATATAETPAEPDSARFRWTDARTPSERRSFALRSAFAILVPALVFAAMHFSAPESAADARSTAALDSLFRTGVAVGLSNVATVLFGVGFLRLKFGATPADFGLGPEFSLGRGAALRASKRFVVDFYRGCVAFVCVAPIVFGLNAGLRALVPDVPVDPAPIFAFALAEGIVYWRTRRVATVVGMHVALNATSLLVLCAAFGLFGL